MVFSVRLITLVIGGAISLFFLTLTARIETNQAVSFLLLYNGILAVLFIADWLLTSKPQVLGIKRIYEHRLSLGAANTIILQVENYSTAHLDLIIKDEPPITFKVNTRRLQAKLLAASVSQLTYTLEPPKRGDYQFGDVNIRYHSRLGLFLRQCKISPATKDIRVYPNLLEIRKYQLLTKQGHLLETGIKPSRMVGMGTDFESLRDYQVDDEYRCINWGATARRGRLTSNQYEIDKSQTILLVLDTGRLMSGEVQGLTKLDHAIHASLLLGYVGANRGDKVGVVAFADEVKLTIPPGKGQPQVQKIIAGLYNLQPEVVESGYRMACQVIGLKNRKRSLICIFTELIDEQASTELITYISSLTKNHLVMCITLIDSSLIEQGRKIPANSQEVYEKGMAQMVLRNREKAIAILKSRGVIVINVPPEELSISTINKYLEIKSRGRL